LIGEKRLLVSQVGALRARQAHPHQARNYLSVGPGEYACGNNLYLVVTPSGGRRWAFRYQRNNVVKKIGLGSAKPAGLKLSEAKDNAIDALRLLAKGTDPREHAMTRGAAKDRACSASSPRSGGRPMRPA
jgi:Arm DNA-binding domain